MKKVQKMNNEWVSKTVSVKNIIIAVLVIVCIKLVFFTTPKIVHTDTSALDNEILLLRDSLVSLNDSIYYSKEAIKVNEFTIDSLYIVKRLDSIRLSKMTMGGQLSFFKDYINNVSPIVVLDSTVNLDRGYISGANNIFLDHDTKTEELKLLYANVVEMKSIVDVCITSNTIQQDLAGLELTVTTLGCEDIKELNKKYKRQLRNQKIVGVAGIVLLIVILA